MTTCEIIEKKLTDLQNESHSLILNNDITVKRFKISAETRLLYKCALNWAETKFIICVIFSSIILKLCWFIIIIIIIIIVSVLTQKGPIIIKLGG